MNKRDVIAHLNQVILDLQNDLIDMRYFHMEMGHEYRRNPDHYDEIIDESEERIRMKYSRFPSKVLSGIDSGV